MYLCKSDNNTNYTSAINLINNWCINLWSNYLVKLSFSDILGSFYIMCIYSAHALKILADLLLVCILLCFTSLSVCSEADDLTLFEQELNLFDLREKEFTEAY